jgi:outer membrane protein assembly factor BamC
VDRARQLLTQAGGLNAPAGGKPAVTAGSGAGGGAASGKGDVRATGPQLTIDEPFDRAWRRVGLALDRGGFSVEDRDRSVGLFYVRYIDPKLAGIEEPNFFAKLFGAKGPDKTPVRYRVALKGEGGKTTVAVQSSAGEPETGDAAKAIVAQLVRELR